jgi:hypothetical protein
MLSRLHVLVSSAEEAGLAPQGKRLFEKVIVQQQDGKGNNASERDNSLLIQGSHWPGPTRQRGAYLKSRKRKSWRFDFLHDAEPAMADYVCLQSARSPCNGNPAGTRFKSWF